MEAHLEKPISNDLVQEWLQYIEPSKTSQFELVCAQESTQTINSAIQPFFATWRTSLTPAHVDKLDRLSKDSRLRNLVQTILIEDDSQRLDPWTSPALASSSLEGYAVWPRKPTEGIVYTRETQLGVAHLNTLLKGGLLHPEAIIIRDYETAEMNFRFSSEMAQVRHVLCKQTDEAITSSFHPATISAAGLARDVIRGTNLAVSELTIYPTSLHLAEDSFIHSTHCSEAMLSAPAIQEVIMQMHPPQRGLVQESSTDAQQLDTLRSARLFLSGDATSYWLQRVLSESPALESLTLSLSDYNPDTWTQPGSLLPNLTDFRLSHTTIPAEQILAMLASSAESLRCLDLTQVTLTRRCSWQELIFLLAEKHTLINRFTLAVLREEARNSEPIDLRILGLGRIPEQYQSGLKITEKGPPHEKRATRISYEGPDASIVMRIVSGRTPDKSGTEEAGIA